MQTMIEFTGGGAPQKYLLIGKKLNLLETDRKIDEQNITLSNQKFRSKKAFTLAEVLITLGVIGIVAAMTLPTVITNYKKKQTVVQLKKAYTELSQAMKLAENKHGFLEGWDLSNFATAQERTDYFGENYVYPFIKTVRKCAPSSEECWVDSPDAGSAVNLATGRNSFVTVSGYSVYYWVHQVGNGAWFIVDVNGKKLPNKLGNDQFRFVMSWGNSQTVGSTYAECTKKYGLFPPGIACNDRQITREDILNNTSVLTSPSVACTACNNTHKNGTCCSALIMLDGWEIRDDYPW